MHQTVFHLRHVPVRGSVQFRICICTWAHFHTPQNGIRNDTKLDVKKLELWSLARGDDWCNFRMSQKCENSVQYVFIAVSALVSSRSTRISCDLVLWSGMMKTLSNLTRSPSPRHLWEIHSNPFKPNKFTANKFHFAVNVYTRFFAYAWLHFWHVSITLAHETLW